jgi:hypothetical protein
MLALLSEADFECLAKNVYYEARDQELAGQLAVTFVTLKRVSHKWWPNTICEVVWDDKAFSWTHDGKPDNPYELEVYEEIKRLSKQWISDLDKLVDPTNGATHYCKVNWNCPWEKDPDMIYLTTIDGHDFYEERYRRDN